MGEGVLLFSILSKTDVAAFVWENSATYSGRLTSQCGGRGMHSEAWRSRRLEYSVSGSPGVANTGCFTSNPRGMKPTSGSQDLGNCQNGFLMGKLRAIQ